MNILEQEDIVKGMPDEVLIAQSQNPTGGIPQFLLVSEIQRREKMRANYQGDQQQMPMPTVTEQVVQQGIASLNPDPDPLMNTAMGIPQQPMMTAAGGGMMPYRMSTGRDIPYFEEGFYDLPEELLRPAIDAVLQMRGGGIDRVQGILGEYARRRGIDPLEFIERNLPTLESSLPTSMSEFPSMERVSKTIDKFAGDAAKTDVSKITPDDVNEELITMASAPGAGGESKVNTSSLGIRPEAIQDFKNITANIGDFLRQGAESYEKRKQMLKESRDLTKGREAANPNQMTTFAVADPLGDSSSPNFIPGPDEYFKEAKIDVNPIATTMAADLNERGPAGADFGSGPPEEELSPFGPYREDYKFDGRVQPESKNLGDQFTKFVSEDSPDVKDYREVIEAMLGRAYKPMDEGALALVNLGAGIAKGDIGAGLLGATKAIGEERDRTRKDMVARATAAYYLGGGRGSKGTADSALFRQALTDINKEFGGRAKLAEEYKKRVGDLPPDGQASKTALKKFKNFLIMERARLYAQMNQQYGGASFGPASGSNVDMDQVGRDIQNSLNINKFSQ